MELPMAEISDFPDHPFKVRMDAAMTEMVDSVRQYGVLVPRWYGPCRTELSDGGRTPAQTG